MWTNLEQDESRGELGGGGAYLHTLHTKCEKECNLHVNGGMISKILYHTLAYYCYCVKFIKVAYLNKIDRKAKRDRV